MWVGLASVTRMIIDCGRCAVRGAACADCVVTFLTIEVRETIEVRAPGHPRSAARAPDPGGAAPVLGRPALDLDGAASDLDGAALDLDGAEQAALEVLASSGLVPPLRLALLDQTG